MKRAKRSRTVSSFTIGAKRIVERRTSKDGRYEEQTSIARERIPVEALPTDDKGNTLSRYSSAETLTEYYVGKDTLTIEYIANSDGRRKLARFCRENGITLGAIAQHIGGKLFARTTFGPREALQSLAMHPLVIRSTLSHATPSVSNAAHLRTIALYKTRKWTEERRAQKRLDKEWKGAKAFRKRAMYAAMGQSR